MVRASSGQGTIGFLGLNLGLAAFVVSLLGDLIWLERIAAPVMGGGIVVVLATNTWRLAVPPSEAAPVEAVGALSGS